MKNYLLIFVTSLIICSLSCKNLFAKDSLTSNFTHLLLEGDIIGEEFNLPGSKSRGAVSYGVANNGGYSLKDDTGFVKPEMVMKLADVIHPPMPGPVEAVNEVSYLKILTNFCCYFLNFITNYLLFDSKQSIYTK